VRTQPDSFCFKTERNGVSNHQRQGYEIYAFFGTTCRSFHDPSVSTSSEAAHAYAARFPCTYIIEESGGFYVYGPEEASVLTSLSLENEVLFQGWMDSPDTLLAELSLEDRIALREFLDTPVEEHLERWKKGVPWKRKNS
jgi:hypothetical protein